MILCFRKILPIFLCNTWSESFLIKMSICIGFVPSRCSGLKVKNLASSPNSICMPATKAGCHCSFFFFSLIKNLLYLMLRRFLLFRNLLLLMLGKHEFSEIRIENRLAGPIDNKKIMIFLYFNTKIPKKKEIIWIIPNRQVANSRKIRYY